ncbi:MAG: O-antigen ligase family protein [Planctomycetaceae bacterium]|nr:O-antigen ligase family protein [Planctomycetaceae bacterium]
MPSPYEDSRPILESAAICLLVIVLVAAPWLLGGFLFEHQFYLWIGALLCCALTWVNLLYVQGEDIQTVPWVVVPAGLFLMLSAAQLLPLDFAMSDWKRIAIPDWFPVMSQRATWTIDPALTRIQLMRFTAACCLLWAASQLLANEALRGIVWWALAFNGAALTIFGIVQRVLWNGKLFWVVELTQGGQPFASFVNRNHAAGYLNLCFAAALVLWWTSCQVVPRKMAHRIPEEIVPTSRSFLTGWFPAMLVLINAVGVCASYSRGGLLSLVATGVCVVLFSGNHFRARVLVLIALTALLGGIALVATDQAEAVRDRLETLKDSAQGFDARWQHWQDTAPAILDAPWGTGLGTYRLANRPFQAHPTAGVFHNADNLYLEMLVENGWAGAVTLLVALLLVWIQVGRLYFSPNPISHRLSILGLAILISQGLQAATDFGPLMTANLLTLATMLGALYVTVPAIVEEEMAHHLINSKKAHNLILGSLLIAASILALIVFDHAQRRELLLRRPLPEDHPVPMESIDAQIASANQLLRQFPDDAEVRLVQAQLHVLAFRVATLEAMRQEAPEADAEVLWPQTQLPVLYDIVRSLEAPEVLAEVRQNPVLQRYLPPALTHAEQAHAASPLLPETRLIEGMLAVVLGDSDDPHRITQLIQAEATLFPDSPERLFGIGLLLNNSPDNKSRDRLWSRAFAMRPEKPGFLLGRMRSVAEETELFGLLPPDPELWTTFLQTAQSDQESRKTVDRMLKTRMADAQFPPEQQLYLEGLSQMNLQDLDTAIPLLQGAVDAAPSNVSWRISLFDALHAAGRTGEAQTQLEEALRLDPDRRELKLRQQSP